MKEFERVIPESKDHPFILITSIATLGSKPLSLVYITPDLVFTPP